MRLRLLIVEGTGELLDDIARFCEREADMEVLPCASISDAKDVIRAVVADRGRLDAAFVADRLTDGHGFTFIDCLRDLPEESVLQGGLRCRHIPVVATCAYLTGESKAWLRDIDAKISILLKPYNFRAVLRAVDNAIGAYRHDVMVELDRAGLAITYDEGKFHILDGYLTRPFELIETKLVATKVSEVGRLSRRLILSAERAELAAAAVEELEELLNDKASTETALHSFFRRHPEFLADQGYSWYWSELTLQNPTTTDEIRPDFIFRPLLARVPWEWHILDLKSPHVKLTAYERFHQDWSSHVHHVVRQLRNYRNFFRDPRNREVLEHRFGGVVPSPKLTAVLGRDYTNTVTVADLVSDLADVRIRTYDEVLSFRREQVDRLRAAIEG